MSKEEAILQYKTSMSLFKKWAADGLISADELLVIDTMIAEKYGVSLSSIYRENGLQTVRKLRKVMKTGQKYGIIRPSRKLMGCVKNGVHSGSRSQSGNFVTGYSR